MKEKYNIVELFSGIGSQARALKNIGIQINVQATCEWDIHAFIAYDAMHESIYNLPEVEKMSKEELIKFDAIVVDEVQFCSKREIEFLVKIVDDYNITVLCYGLRTSSTNKLFEGAYWLFAWANEIEEIKSVCWCGDGATHNARIDENGNIIKEGPMVVLGGNDTYVSLCRKHYNQNMPKGYVKVKD